MTATDISSVDYMLSICCTAGRIKTAFELRGAAYCTA
jgi:hypothetical protein